MSAHRTQQVLYETEAALRLVDRGLDGLREETDEPALLRTPLPASAFAGLPGLIERAAADMLGILARLRESRAAIEATALGTIASTQEKLREVASVTECSALIVRDACDRATRMVDELDGIAAEPDHERARAVRGALRDELGIMLGALPSQDLAAQQLAHAAAVLVDAEHRLLDVARLLDPRADTVGERALTPLAFGERSGDSGAAARSTEWRPAFADALAAFARSS